MIWIWPSASRRAAALVRRRALSSSLSAALTDELKARLRVKAAARLDAEGQIQITSQLTRNQSDNLEDAREKLAALLRSAMVTPKARRKTKPSRAKKAKRVAEKRVHAAKKQSRGRVSSKASGVPAGLPSTTAIMR